MEIVDNERRTSAYPDFNRFDDASDYVGFIKIMKGVFSKSVNDFIIVLTESVNGGCAMNERFFSLSAEKQQAIINAGYRVFSQQKRAVYVSVGQMCRNFRRRSGKLP